MKTVSLFLILLLTTTLLHASGICSTPTDIAFQITKHNDTTTKLEWSNTDLQEGEFYKIEHSNDGKTFFTISQFPYELVLQYDKVIFIHQTPINGENYYQLKRNNRQGALLWKSKAQSIHFDLPPLMVQVSSTASALQVQFKLLVTDQAKVIILDKEGNTQSEFFVKGVRGTNHLTIPSIQLSEEAFMLSVEVPDCKVYRKIPLKTKNNIPPRA